MLDLDAVRNRLEDRVEDLRGRLFTAAEFTRLMDSNAAPAGGVNAYLIPGSIIGQATQGSGLTSGLFRQGIRRGIALVVFLRDVDRHGKRALESLATFLDTIIAAVCGWAPGDEIGVFELLRAGIIPTRHRGVMAYQFEFFIPDQLRIAP